MTRPRLLDLFCGAGGAAEGYHRAGFEVVGVDIEPQPNYPFEFFRDDALDFLRLLLEDWGGGPVAGPDYDAIHASPPCQAYSDLAHHPQNRDNEYPDLVRQIRGLLQATGLPWVIENVVGAPLINPVQLCGSSFDLGVKRHRLFECNFPVMAAPCAHGGRPKRYRVFQKGEWIDSAFVPVYGMGGGKAIEHWPEAMGIDWMTRAEMAEAIPPTYTEHIGHYLMTHLKATAETGTMQA